MLPAKDSNIEPISRFRNLYSPFQSESPLSILLRRPIGVMGRHGADKRIGANHDMFPIHTSSTSRIVTLQLARKLSPTWIFLPLSQINKESMAGFSPKLPNNSRIAASLDTSSMYLLKIVLAKFH